MKSAVQHHHGHDLRRWVKEVVTFSWNDTSFHGSEESNAALEVW